MFMGMPISVSAEVGDVSTDGYQIDNYGNLTIANDTSMTNWLSVRRNYQIDVKSVQIESGVTSIGGAAFDSV